MELDESHELPELNHSQTITKLRDDDLDEKIWDASIDAERRVNIEDASQILDIQQLARIATLPGGFLTDELRRKACTVFHLP